MRPDPPLVGRRVVVTRPAADAAALCEALRSAGAFVVPVPAFRLAAVESSPLESRLRAAGRVAYDTVVFTSQNAVKYFLEIAGRAGVGSLGGVEVAAIGPATAAALERRGIRPDLVGETHTAEGLVDAIRRAHPGRAGLAGRRVLYPAAVDARDVVAHELALLGARVEVVATYGAVPEVPDDPDAVGRLLDPPPEVVTFASPSAVILLERTLTPAVFARVGGGLKIRSVTACIGPVTEDAARRSGYRVEIVARSHTTHGLVGAVISYYSQKG